VPAPLKCKQPALTLKTVSTEAAFRDQRTKGCDTALQQRQTQRQLQLEATVACWTFWRCVAMAPMRTATQPQPEAKTRAAMAAVAAWRHCHHSRDQNETPGPRETLGQRAAVALHF